MIAAFLLVALAWLVLVALSTGVVLWLVSPSSPARPVAGWWMRRTVLVMLPGPPGRAVLT
jgi:hypothetical protein